LFKNEPLCGSKSLHDLTNIDYNEIVGKYHVKRPAIKLSDIWSNRPSRNTGNIPVDQKQKAKHSGKDTVNRFYVTQFVREKENAPKKQKKIVKKTQNAINSDEKTLEREAQEIYQEILETVKKYSLASPVVSELGEPVGILKNKNKERPRKDRDSSSIRAPMLVYPPGAGHHSLTNKGHPYYGGGGLMPASPHHPRYSTGMPPSPLLARYSVGMPSLQLWKEPETKNNKKKGNNWFHVF